MATDVHVGKLLEALDRAGGLSELLPSLNDVTGEQCLEAADRAERLGYIQARNVQRTAGNVLKAIIDVRITPEGTTYLRNYRRSAPHEGQGADYRHDGPGSPSSRQERRTRFMRAVYEATDGSEIKVVDGPNIGSEFGWPPQETDDVLRYWEGEGLIEYVAEEGAIVITHPGVVEVERALTSPAIPTEHFPANTIIIGGSVYGAQIQAGSPHASQFLSHGSGDGGDLIDEFLVAIRLALASDPTPDVEEIEEMMSLVEEQRGQERPNKKLVAALVATLRQVTIGMASNAAWAGAVALAHQISH